MAGIYIHVPFCRTRCHYCDFFKSTKVDLIDQYFQQLLEELRERQNFFITPGIRINSVYFGGGTPSLASPLWLDHILKTISSVYDLDKAAEITLEANPDDLSYPYLKEIKNTGINRLSLGIQSFFEDDLQKMGRRHNARQSHEAISYAFEAGFENVGIDLIYGLPWAGTNKLKENLHILDQYPVKHLSAYHLTIEPGTRFGKEKMKKQLFELKDEESERLFWLLHDETRKMGFDQYEISNFCKEGFHSRHNSSYWSGEPYLGAGPGAHSFDGVRRYWNKPYLHQYVASGFASGVSEENLSETDRFNERLMLGLRTRKGISSKEMEIHHPEFWLQIQKPVENWIERGFLQNRNGRISGTRSGWFVIDGIIEDLFIL